MSARFLVDDSPELGMRQYAEVDADGVTLITEGTNIRAALDANQKCRSVHTQAPRGDQSFANHVASIPVWQWENFCRENPELRQWTKDSQVWLLSKLNSGDYCNLKTFDGRA